MVKANKGVYHEQTTTSNRRWRIHESIGEVGMKISHSRIETYERCKRLYELKYKYNLEPIKENRNFAIGKEFHAEVQGVIEGKRPYTPMGKAFDKYVDHSKWKVGVNEKEFLYSLGDDIMLHGFIDRFTPTGLVEFKTVGRAVDEKYEYGLRLDRQHKLYCASTGIQTIDWVAIQKCKLKHKSNETLEEHEERVFKWYQPKHILNKTLTVTRNEMKETLEEALQFGREMRDRKFFPRNPSACAIMECDFADICLSKDPENSIGFMKKEKI